MTQELDVQRSFQNFCSVSKTRYKESQLRLYNELCPFSDDGHAPAAATTSSATASRHGGHTIIIFAMVHARAWRGNSSRFHGAANESCVCFNANSISQVLKPLSNHWCSYLLAGIYFRFVDHNAFRDSNFLSNWFLTAEKYLVTVKQILLVFLDLRRSRICSHWDTSIFWVAVVA